MSTPERRGLHLPRYRWGARVYDHLSAERFVYRHGRLVLSNLLGLKPGERVLLVGCGTGLDLPWVTAAVGSTGQVVGVDRSPAMLDQARAKVATHAWSHVELVLTDAARLEQIQGPFDAVVFSYSLSIIDDERAAWRAALDRLAPGGRVAVLDTDLPTGVGRALLPLAAFALWTGGVHRRRQVWTLVEQVADDVQTRSLAQGHLRLAVGTPRPTANTQDSR
ncbi:MAG: methyltransferase domain-containing protein [Nocardioidaceae bacterium]|nr:methyltransferase domain-containing protein [Nocardioidaceae bacterium]